jgi:NAD(P)H-hydrate epimerase
MSKKLENFDNPGDFDFSPYQALVLGPGWGIEEPRDNWLIAAVDSGLPGVLDADGITLAARMAEDKRLPSFEDRWILTPHPGECARISGRSKEEVLTRPYETVLETSRSLQAVVVLKTHVVIVGYPDGEFRVVDGMNPAMAGGGSGDILSGVIGGLLAAGMGVKDAAVLGTLLHQFVGKRARAEKGWFLSEDLLPFLSLEV